MTRPAPGGTTTEGRTTGKPVWVIDDEDDEDDEDEDDNEEDEGRGRAGGAEGRTNVEI